MDDVAGGRMAGRALATGAVALALLLPGALGRDRSSEQWRTGPVRYLLTRAEDRAFRNLRTDEERAAFIEAFWKRRDPTPETPRNEFREQFQDRVARTESLRLYLETTKPMWLTDMGKIYILLGPPVSESRSLVATDTRDTVIWSYDQVPGVPQNHFTIAFVADESGEMRISESPMLDQSTVQGLAPHAPIELFLPGGPDAPIPQVRTAAALRSAELGGVGNFIAGWRFAGRDPPWDPVFQAVGETSGPSVLGRAVGLGRLQAPAPLPEGEVRVRPSFEPLPMDLHTDYYQANDGTTYVAFTLGPAGGEDAPDDLDRLIPFGGIVSLDDPDVTFSLNRPDQFAPAGPEAPGVFQTGLGVDPGRYRVLFGLEEPGTGRIGVQQTDLTIPDLKEGRLNLSSITLAHTLRPLAERELPDTSLKRPFVLGKLRVVPRTDPTVRNGDEFHLYYQVYGAQAGPDGSPHLDVTYQFEGDAGDRWEPMGGPVRQMDLTYQAQAWSFPLEGWPLGRFRLTVTVMDRITGNATAGTLLFRVLDGVSPGASP